MIFLTSSWEEIKKDSDKKREPLMISSVEAVLIGICIVVSDFQRNFQRRVDFSV